jgi:type IV fimbrial biogenesis protein FimT
MNTHALSGPDAGFTLVELLVTTAVMAVLLGLATPKMTGLMSSLQLSSASNDLLAGLLLARSEAIKRNSRVVICKSANGISCVSSGNWEQGWIVFHDANNNGRRDAAEPILLREQALGASLRLTGNLNVAHYVSYTPSGATKLVSGGFQAGTLTICQHSAAAGEARQIILSTAGRPRVQKASVPACF